MRRLSSERRRFVKRFLLFAPLVWIGICFLFAGLAGASTYLVVKASTAEGAVGKLQQSASRLSFVAPIAQIAASAPIAGTLGACADLGPWFLPLSAPCLAAEISATGSAAVTSGGRSYHQLTSGDLLSDSRLDLDALRRLAADSSVLDRRLRRADVALSRLESWSVLPAELQQRREAADAALWRADSAVLALPRLVELVSGPRPARFFVGLTSQSETRAGGGLLGMFAIVEIDRGAIEIRQLGSNLDLPNSDSVPRNLDPGFYSLFGVGNPEWQNLNLAPDGATSGQAWLSAWESSTGERLDGALSIDTVTLARLCAASGVELKELGGRVLTTADEITDYISLGIYAEFPRDDLARKAHQSAVFANTITQLLSGADLPPLLSALVTSMSEERSWVYFDQPLLEQMAKTVGIAGWIGDLADDSIRLRFNNLSGNKSDFFLREQSRVVEQGDRRLLRLKLTMAKRLQSIDARIVTNRLDRFADTGRGSYLQLVLATGDAVRAGAIKVNGQATEVRRSVLAGKSVLAWNVNVAVWAPATVEVELSGTPSVDELLTGALVHP